MSFEHDTGGQRDHSGGKDSQQMGLFEEESYDSKERA